MKPSHNQKCPLLTSVIIATCLILAPTARAGGPSRFMIYSTIGDPFPVDRPIHLEYKVYDSHTPSGYVGNSVGERIELRLQDPKPGEYCTMDPITTNSEGIIGGDCHTTNPGGIVVYAYSLDRGDESNHLYLHIVAPSPSPPPESHPHTVAESYPEIDHSTSSRLPTPRLTRTASGHLRTTSRFLTLRLRFTCTKSKIHDISKTLGANQKLA